jgi:hypothetical protein
LNTINTVLIVVSLIDTVLLIYLVARRTILWARGISPAIYRLGNGLANRKIAVFAKNDNGASLRSLLIQSKLFRDKNIFSIAKKDDIGIAERASVYLMFWPDWKDNLDDILTMKPDSCALIVYAPRDHGPIPEPNMVKLDGKRHTAVTNFRGRLLNDIVTSMITTSYEQN